MFIRNDVHGYSIKYYAFKKCLTKPVNDNRTLIRNFLLVEIIPLQLRYKFLAAGYTLYKTLFYLAVITNN